MTERHLQKSIGQIFKTYNIIEYKSPKDYFSINDFYKVISYACLYQSNTENVMEISPKEITITLVLRHYPRKLIHHLIQEHHVKVQAEYPGIFYVTGLLFSMQIVLIKGLPRDEYVWLSRLRENLSVQEDIPVLAKAYRGREKKCVTRI